MAARGMDRKRHVSLSVQWRRADILFRRGDLFSGCWTFRHNVYSGNLLWIRMIRKKNIQIQRLSNQYHLICVRGPGEQRITNPCTARADSSESEHRLADRPAFNCSCLRRVPAEQQFTASSNKSCAHRNAHHAISRVSCSPEVIANHRPARRSLA